MDLSQLNKYVHTNNTCLHCQHKLMRDISTDNAAVFTKLDAMNGYHQCPLNQKSQELTTFITPFRQFKFLRALYGLSPILEHYNRQIDEAFSGLSGFHRVLDNVVI